MSDGWLIALTCVHIMTCCVTYMLIRRGILHATYAYIIIVLLIPVFGLASMVGIEIAANAQPGKKRAQTMNVDESLCRAIVKDDDDGAMGAVPLEEVLLMNDTKTRRAIMMDVLHNEPVRYIAQLKMARLNSDMEVAHYATATIMEIQREFDTSLQRLEQLLAQGNECSGVLDEAIELVGRYIRSGLLDGFSLKRMRERYLDLLTRKIGLQPHDRQAWLAFVQNKIDLEDFAGAEAGFSHMAGQWPDAEETWLLGLRLAVERRDRNMLEVLVSKMEQAPVHWSEQGQKIVMFWAEHPEKPAGDPAQSTKEIPS